MTNCLVYLVKIRDFLLLSINACVTRSKFMENLILKILFDGNISKKLQDCSFATPYLVIFKDLNCIIFKICKILQKRMIAFDEQHARVKFLSVDLSL